MKKLICGILLTVALMALMAPVATHAGILAFSGRGTLFSTNCSYFITSASAEKLGEARVDYLNVTADTNNAVVQFYTASNPCPNGLTAASSGTTNTLRLTNGTAYAQNSILVIQHIANDVYERAVVLTSSNAFLTLSNATLFAVAKFDRIWLCSTNASLPVGDTRGLTPQSKEFAPPKPLYYGESQTPLLIEVRGHGTNTVSLNAVAGTYSATVINGAVNRN